MVRSKIVLVPFPFDDLSGYKLRPVVCLTEPIGKHKHVIVSFISSRVPEENSFNELLLRKDDPQLQNSGLKKDSVILLHRLVTLHEGIFQRELGVLPEKIMNNIIEKLVHLLKNKASQ